MISAIVLIKLATECKVSNVLVFLRSSVASYINSTDINLDAAVTIKVRHF